MRFRIAWLPLREAAAFVARHHRHHDPAQGGIVALGCWEGERLVGCAVLARPVSRHLQAQGVAEVTRLCVLPDLAPTGQHAAGAASQLYARIRRVGMALGFTQFVTYTLPSESGASLRGDGWRQDELLAGGGEWTAPSRPRAAATHPTEPKRRWWHGVRAQGELTP